MAEITRRHQGSTLPEFLVDPFAMLDLRPRLDFHPIRVEDSFTDSEYVLRAELPGVDPEHDVELVVSAGTLTILAERSSEKHDKRHTEFRYGAFSRNVRLPDGAKEDKISATYSAGILTVTVPLTQPAKASSRKIPVKREQ